MLFIVTMDITNTFVLLLHYLYLAHWEADKKGLTALGVLSVVGGEVYTLISV